MLSDTDERLGLLVLVHSTSDQWIRKSVRIRRGQRIWTRTGALHVMKAASMIKRRRIAALREQDQNQNANPDGRRYQKRRRTGVRSAMGLLMFVGTTAIVGCSQSGSLFSNGDKSADEPSEQQPETNDAQQEIEYRPTRPRGQVASFDRPITMFGDLSSRESVAYSEQAAMSLTQHTFAEEGVDSDPQISRDGTFMVFASTRHHHSPDIYRKNIDGVAIAQITGDPAADVQPAISPDGRFIAFASNRTGNWDIWIVELDGRRPVQVTSGPEDEVHPSWSPDGKRLVYCSLAPRGQWELWIADAEAGGQRNFVGYGLFPEWAPDSSTILYQRARERGSQWFSIWTIELVNDEPMYPTEIASSIDHSLIAPAWSATGSHIAFCGIPKADHSADQATAEQAVVWVVNRDGTNRIPLTDGLSANFSPTWSPQGRVYFTRRRGLSESIWSLRPPNTDPNPGFTEQSPQPPSDVSAVALNGDDS